MDNGALAVMAEVRHRRAVIQRLRRQMLAVAGVLRVEALQRSRLSKKHRISDLYLLMIR
jgi:hypothetical protein